jgi:surface antigen
MQECHLSAPVLPQRAYNEAAMRTSFFILALATLTGFSVAPAHAGEDQFFGTLFGMTAGGLIGNQFGHGTSKDVATVLGVAGGGLIGNDLGRAADNANYGTAQTYYMPPYAYEPPVYYYNGYNAYQPNYVAPTSPSPADQPVTYINKASGYCREVSQQVDVNGSMQEIYGTACLQRDGTWRVVQ